MKITGGKYKFKNVDSTRQKELRPTSSRVRESIFNLVRHGKFRFHENYIETNDDLLQDATIADLYCGTGIMAFEALSRGASYAILVEKNQNTLDLAKHNAQILGEDRNIQAIGSDATLLPIAKRKVDLVFMDPPYKKFLIRPTLQSLEHSKWLKKGTVIFAEHGKSEEIKPLENFQILDRREYNNTHVTILQYTLDS